MPMSVRASFTYANVAASLALMVALAAAVTLLPRPVEAVSTGGTWFLGGTFSDLPLCFSCEISLAPTGYSSFGSINNTSNEVLSPSVAVTASNLSIHLETAPGTGTRKIFLSSHSDAAHSLNCSITGASTTCNSGAQTLKIAPGTLLFIDVANQGNAPASKLEFSWLATP